MTTDVLPPYEALASVYDRWTEGRHYARWADFVAARISADRSPPVHVLDICCGTGEMAARLRARGCRVTGVDRSPQMLEQARSRLGNDVGLILADIREMDLREAYSAAICTFDSLNYLVGEGDLQAVLNRTAQALRPGGLMIFDVNTRHKLENVFGDSHYGDDFGDFAYVWRNSYEPGRHRTTFRITLFRRRPDGCFVRCEERHEQRWFGHPEIEAAATRAGFEVAEVLDDYGSGPVTAASMRETWILRRVQTSR